MTPASTAWFPSGVTIPANAGTMGMWSALYNWPLITVHAVLLPDGRVLSFGTNADGTQTGNFIYDVWDGGVAPDAGHLTLPNGTGTDIFCSSTALLAQAGSANVFIGGGDIWNGTKTENVGNPNSNLFNGADNSLKRGLDMNRARWYSSAVTMLDGSLYIQGGSGGNDLPERRNTDGTFSLLSNAYTYGINTVYPRNFVAPDGRIFGYDIAGNMYYVDTTGKGVLTKVGQLDAQYTGAGSSSAMFSPGRILQFGGASNGAVIIDLASGAPVITPTQSMSTRRDLVSGAVLPDGTVLATGGSEVYNVLTGVNTTAEIWNPQTGQWSVGASGAVARLYHSSSLLLPDASVLVSGGGAPGPLNNTNAEIYFPPYLFTAAGKLAARPVIATAPATLDIGKTFSVNVTSGTALSKVVLIRTGANTHSFNESQRFINLTYAGTPANLKVQAPTRAADAPPGYYMLFVLDAAGVPSIAKIVFVNVAANPNPATVPVLANPGNQSASVGSAQSLALVASDPNGDTLSYAATGLPPGLSLNATTGLISGTPSAGGSYNVVVTASDGVNVASASFVWNVVDTTPLTITQVPTPSPVVSGASASFTASATGMNPLYQWNFGDGSATTAYSSAASVTHTYAAGGIYNVTLSVTDDRGIVQSRTFTQVIYLPATAGKPAASTNILVETPASGHARVWVLNQDNDSATAFDAVTRAKLAEVNAGAGPRSFALAPGGYLWVADKQGATITVINTATLSLARVINLPRASQPFGIVISPAGDSAYVTLEALGQVLKFSTSSYAQTGSLAVGPSPRHLSITGDGKKLYVSRFITPPLPGEATASVTPSASTGGEVVVVATAGFTVTGKVVLQHSDKPDAENQGRGIPNYLGAAVISPDGTQAWVPSKQDNIKRGSLRDGNALNFQNTVRAISSRIVLATDSEDLGKRVDHDNSSLGSAAAYDPTGVYLFVALETSREVAVVNAFGASQVLRFDAGRAPEGLAVSADGQTLYVNNFMDRTVGVYDLSALLGRGQLSVPLVATLAAVGVDKLPAAVLTGKQFFYDARDTRLARDSYMSCATCHNDGGRDGRTWDFTGQGEGLRNTIALKGRAGMGQGNLHWSGNFDEVQDFEGQIRALAGGTGLMSDADFTTGTRSQPLGDKKAGISPSLDALAAYLGSLATFDNSPARTATGDLSALAVTGKAVFTAQNCASCHGGAAFTNSANGVLMNIGTLKPTSGYRLGGPLTGIDIPTLRDAWATAPYLHDGSAPSVEAAIGAHVISGTPLNLSASDLTAVAEYVREIGAEEFAAPDGSTGLAATYFNNMTLTGAPVLTRTEAVDFDWGQGSPGTGVVADGFSARWSGTVQVPTSGAWTFQTVSDDGVRLWINGTLVIDDWAPHAPTTDTAAPITLTAGASYAIRMEYYDLAQGAVARLRWQAPGATGFVAVPQAQLKPASPLPPITPAGTGLAGTYFANATLTGTPVLARTEAVDFDWGAGSPDASVPADQFSARWSGTVMAPTSGSYYFQTVSDDGVRVWVNGTLVIDDWTPHQVKTDTTATPVALVGGQSYAIKVEYFEGTGLATMRLRWRLPATTAYVAIPQGALYPAAVSAPSASGGSGLLGSYFANMTLTGSPAALRTEAVDYDWGGRVPIDGVPGTLFSVRWSGSVQAPATGNFFFQTVSDDGIRLWVNGVLVVDNWTNHGPTTNTTTAIALAAGQRYAIKIEYFQNTGGDTARLRWLVPGASTYVAVPASALFPG